MRKFVPREKLGKKAFFNAMNHRLPSFDALDL